MSVSEPEGQARRRRRRIWSAEEKRRIVAEAIEPGASVSVVARRHDLNANMLFTWRRQAAATGTISPAAAMTFVPAAITAEPVATVSPAQAAAAGRMKIVLAGGIEVIVGADVDAGALARVIKVLSRR
jgi:transposase